MAESYRVEKGEVLLTVRSLHQDEHHRNGDIRVTSKENGPSIRQLILEHSRRAGLKIVLSEEELGDPTQYAGTASLPQLARTAETSLPTRNLRRILGNRTTTQETPLIEAPVTSTTAQTAEGTRDTTLDSVVASTYNMGKERGQNNTLVHFNRSGPALQS